MLPYFRNAPVKDQDRLLYRRMGRRRDLRAARQLRPGLAIRRHRRPDRRLFPDADERAPAGAA